ncbi:MAG: hypothetical protein AAF646_14585 [Pseudomonadota bacterium]
MSNTKASLLARVAAFLSFLSLLLPALVAYNSVIHQAPVFNDQLLLAGVTGGSRLRHIPAMYDRGAYLFQTGSGFLNADLALLDGEGGDVGAASYEVATARLELAATYLTESLRFDPSNPLAWQGLAQASLALGDLHNAEGSYLRSVALAPHHVDLALARVFFVSELRETLGTPAAYASNYERDLLVIGTHNHDLLKRVLSDIQKD